MRSSINFMIFMKWKIHQMTSMYNITFGTEEHTTNVFNISELKQTLILKRFDDIWHQICLPFYFIRRQIFVSCFISFFHHFSTKIRIHSFSSAVSCCSTTEWDKYRKYFTHSHWLLLVSFFFVRFLYFSYR
jgi:hypothetical protein